MVDLSRIIFHSTMSFLKDFGGDPGSFSQLGMDAVHVPKLMPLEGCGRCVKHRSLRSGNREKKGWVMKVLLPKYSCSSGPALFQKSMLGFDFAVSLLK